MGSREFGRRTGNLDKLDYDQAVAEGLGAIFDDEKNQYFLPMVDSKGRGIFIRPQGSDAPIEIRRALVVFKKPEPTNVNDILPMIVLNLDDISFNAKRLLGVTEQYRLASEGAHRVKIGNELGWDSYETREQEWPFDLIYTIECWSRFRVVANQLLQMAQVKYPGYGSLTVTDSINNERVYHTFQEGTQDLTEVDSLVERYCGYSLTIRVEGEYSNEKIAFDAPAFLGQTIPASGGGGGGGGGGGIDLGPGGLIGDGRPTERVTLIEPDE